MYIQSYKKSILGEILMKDKLDFLNQIMRDTGKGIKGYLKAQLILMFITFLILAIGLDIIDVSYSILIAILIAIVDILPVLGSGIIMIPWSLINFILGNNSLGKDIAILYIILTISRQFIEPKIVGKEIGVRPLYTFLSTIIGSIILGPIGIIIGPLIAVVITSVLKSRKK